MKTADSATVRALWAVALWGLLSFALGLIRPLFGAVCLLAGLIGAVVWTAREVTGLFADHEAEEAEE